MICDKIDYEVVASFLPKDKNGFCEIEHYYLEFGRMVTKN
jgi:hypothetical protein